MSPTAARRPCPGRGKRYHNCPNLVGYGERYCQDCLPVAKREEAKYNQERDQTEARQWIHSTRWRRASRAFLDLHPLCAECERQGRTRGAYLVDHIIPHEGDYELFWNESNWQSMCVEDHEKKHGPERWGR